MDDVLDSEIIETEVETISRWENLLCKFGFHKWTKWRRVFAQYRLFDCDKDNRYCVICNRHQEKKIKND